MQNSDSSTFSSLVSGMDDDERNIMLGKLKKGSSVEDSNIEISPSSKVSDISDLSKQLKSQSLFYRLILWIKAFFTSRTPLEAYNDDLLITMAQRIEHKTSSLLDYRKKALRNVFYEKLKALYGVQKFFKPLIKKYEEKPGSFYVVLSSLILPELVESIESECDPYSYSTSKKNTQMKASLLEKLESNLSSISNEGRLRMYAAARGGEWLKSFCHFPIETFLSKFAPLNDGLNGCYFKDAASYIDSFAKIMCNGKNIPDRLMEALYLFSRGHRKADEEGIDEDDERNFMNEASLNVAVLENFLNEVPLQSIACVVLRNSQYSAESLTGGEDWFQKFKAEWNRLFEYKFSLWTCDYRLERVKEKIFDYFEMDALPVLKYRPWEKIKGNFEFKYPDTSGFLIEFFKKPFAEYRILLKQIAFEGDFEVKENREEFNNSVACYERVGEEILAMERLLAPEGEYGDAFLKFASRGNGKNNDIIEDDLLQIMENVNSITRAVTDGFGEASRSMQRLLASFCSESTSTRYGILNNFNMIGGKENRKFKAAYDKTRFGLIHAFEIMKELEEIETMLPSKLK